MAGNGNSGRRRTPTAMLMATGGYRPDRHADRKGPAVEGVPAKPRGLSKAAASLWDLIVPEMIETGIVKSLDTASLTALCEMWGFYRQSVEVAKEDPISKDARIAVTSYFAAFERMASRFGMTPDARERLTISDEQIAEIDPFQEWLDQRDELRRISTPQDSG